MRRVRMVETGWEKDFQYEDDAPLPTPVGSMVLVEVEACGVCHRDLLDRSGRFPFLQLPITPGHEVAGRVVAVGSTAPTWKPGDRVGTRHRDACGECAACKAGDVSSCDRAAFVLGLMADGGYASHILVPDSCLYALPEDLPAAQAAIALCTFGTAWRGLQPIGPRVLITGANGGVGAAAVQLASQLGSEVIAVVRDERHREFVESLGAKQVLVGDDFHKQVRGIDVALDCVGQATFNSTLRTLRIGGRVVAVGNISTERVALNLGYVIVNGLKIVGSSGATREDMAALFAKKLSLQLPITELPLERADEAQRLLHKGGIRGRVVLKCQ